MVMIRRRTLLAAAGFAMSAASSPAERPGVKVGVNLLSIAANKWTPFQYVDYLAKAELQQAQINLNILAPIADDATALAKLRAHASHMGVELIVLDGSVCPTSSGFNRRLGTIEEQLTRSLRIARALGSTAMKVTIGSAKERPEIAKHIESTTRFLKSRRAQILDSGVKLAMENHSDFQAHELKMLIEEVGTDIMGVLLDSANPLFTLEDPHLTLEVLGPYAVLCHVRDTAVWRVPEGVAARWVNLGDGNVGIDRWVKQFMQMRPGVAVTVENIVSPEPHIMRVFEPEIWRDYPKMSAAELSRFLALAERGRPVAAVR